MNIKIDCNITLKINLEEARWLKEEMKYPFKEKKGLAAEKQYDNINRTKLFSALNSLKEL